MDDTNIIDGLINEDDKNDRKIFRENCRPLFMSIINKAFSYHVDLEEFVNEFCIFLMESDSSKLRQLEGCSSIVRWLVIHRKLMAGFCL